MILEKPPVLLKKKKILFYNFQLIEETTKQEQPKNIPPTKINNEQPKEITKKEIPQEMHSQ